MVCRLLQPAGSLRFNRDIVECKEGWIHPEVDQRLRFNRDIVECKDA